MKTSLLWPAAGLGLAAVLLTGCYKVTGGGGFTLSSGSGIFAADNSTIADFTGDQCTFTFTGQEVPSDSTEDMVPAKGQVQVVDQTSGVVFQGTIDQTGNPEYQSFFPNMVSYWGSGGQVKIGSSQFVPTGGFQLTVTVQDDGQTTAFLGVGVGDNTLIFQASLDNGNVTLHTN